MIRRIAQYLADDIIKKLEMTNDEMVIKHLYEFGLMLDYFCIDVFNIYLD